MPGHRFKVSAVLPIAASDYFIERDSAAFRSLVSKVGIYCHVFGNSCASDCFGYPWTSYVRGLGSGDANILGH